MFKAVSLFTLAMTVASALNSPAQAGEIVGEPKTVTISHKGKDLEPQTSARTQISANIFEIVAVRKTVQETVYDCDDQPSNGSKGDWKNFFNVPRAEKAAALSAAVKGIGMKTAERLVRDGSFSSKPRSWSEFKNVIREADERYQTGFSNEVINTYGQENRRNLGYLVENCGYKVITHTVWVQEKQYRNTMTRNFLLNIMNGNLLKGEEEDFSITFDGFEARLATSSYYNNYTYSTSANSNGEIVFNVFGQRNAVNAPNSLSLSLARTANGLKVKLFDLNFDRDVSENLDRTAIVVIQKKNPWYKKNETLTTIEVPLSRNSAISETDVTVRLARGETTVVKYTIRYNSSKFYNVRSPEAKKSEIKN